MCEATDEVTKNHWEDDEGFDGGLMCEKPGPNCPVVSFELYVIHVDPPYFSAKRETSPLLRLFGTTTWWSESIQLVRK